MLSSRCSQPSQGFLAGVPTVKFRIPVEHLASRWNEIEPRSASNSNAWSTISLPAKVRYAVEFEASVILIRKALAGKVDNERRKGRFLNLMYYLLGWMVRDLGKNFSSKRPWARLRLDLCLKHPQNLLLGNFVMDCVKLLGVPCTRIADGARKTREPHGLHRWQSYFSSVILWLFTACLGLQQSELTSYDPVGMGWLLSASREHRIWFLRGLADSDGNVNIRNKTVEITTEPNTIFVAALCRSLEIHPLTRLSKGVGTVSMSVARAMRVQVFNPDVETHRGLLLRKLGRQEHFGEGGQFGSSAK